MRSLRRHHRERLKKKRASYWGKSLEHSERLLGIVVDTPNPCSCILCGNQRKNLGETLQEKKVKELEKEED